MEIDVEAKQRQFVKTTFETANPDQLSAFRKLVKSVINDPDISFIGHFRCKLSKDGIRVGLKSFDKKIYDDYNLVRTFVELDDRALNIFRNDFESDATDKFRDSLKSAIKKSKAEFEKMRESVTNNKKKLSKQERKLKEKIIDETERFVLGFCHITSHIIVPELESKSRDKNKKTINIFIYIESRELYPRDRYYLENRLLIFCSEQSSIESTEHFDIKFPIYFVADSLLVDRRKAMSQILKILKKINLKFTEDSTDYDFFDAQSIDGVDFVIDIHDLLDKLK